MLRNSPNSFNENPDFHARIIEQQNAKLLLLNTFFNLKEIQKIKNKLTYIIKKNHIEGFKKLFSDKVVVAKLNAAQYDVFLLLISDQRLDMLEWFVNTVQPNINEKINRDAETPFNLAVLYRDNSTKTMRLLLDAGADPNVGFNLTSPKGCTPLQMLTSSQIVDAVQLLLKYNANPNQLDASGDNAFFLAATDKRHRDRQKSIDIAKLFIQRNANPDFNQTNPPQFVVLQLFYKELQQLNIDVSHFEEQDEKLKEEVRLHVNEQLKSSNIFDYIDNQKFQKELKKEYDFHMINKFKFMLKELEVSYNNSFNENKKEGHQKPLAELMYNKQSRFEPQIITKLVPTFFLNRVESMDEYETELKKKSKSSLRK